MRKYKKKGNKNIKLDMPLGDFMLLFAGHKKSGVSIFKTISMTKLI